VAKLRSFLNLPKEFFIFFRFLYPQSLCRTLPFLAAAKVNKLFNSPRNIQSFLTFSFPPTYLPIPSLNPSHTSKHQRFSV
jgi:hypothetical protein